MSCSREGLGSMCLYCGFCNIQKGATALHTACQRGHLKIAETLIIAHANVNAQTKVSVHCICDRSV